MFLWHGNLRPVWKRVARHRVSGRPTSDADTITAAVGLDRWRSLPNVARRLTIPTNGLRKYFVIISCFHIPSWSTNTQILPDIRRAFRWTEARSNTHCKHEAPVVWLIWCDAPFDGEVYLENWTSQHIGRVSCNIFDMPCNSESHYGELNALSTLCPVSLSRNIVAVFIVLCSGARHWLLPWATWIFLTHTVPLRSSLILSSIYTGFSQKLFVLDCNVITLYAFRYFPVCASHPYIVFFYYFVPCNDICWRVRIYTASFRTEWLYRVITRVWDCTLYTVVSAWPSCYAWAIRNFH